MTTGGKGWLTCRQVLNIMVIFGFMLNYALRVNFTIAIVVMAKTLKNLTTGGDMTGGFDNETSTALASVSTTTEQSVISEADKFEWDAYQQNLMLGSFFWGYVLWSVMWFFVVFETPADHPRISAEERNEIESAIGASVKAKKPTYVPWKSILTSPPVWAIILTHGASVFGFFTVVNQLPTYMKYILNFNIKENGLLSSLPYFGKYAMAVISSHLADHLRKNGTLSTTATRKIFTAFAVMTPGFLMIVQVYMGETRSWAVGIFTLALFLNGAVTAGYLGNGLDIAPNFSGTIFGMANTLSSFGGFVSAYMVGVLTNDNQTYGQWQIVFWILAVIYIVGSTAYLIMGTGELQPWNNPPERGINNRETEEGVPLNQQDQNNKPISSST